MRKFKLNIAFVAMIMAVTAAFAFKPAPQKFTDPAWQFNGGSETTASNYTPLDNAVCEEGDNICAITAPANGSTGHPVLSPALQSRITARDQSQGDVFVKQ